MDKRTEKQMDKQTDGWRVDRNEMNRRIKGFMDRWILHMDG